MLFSVSDIDTVLYQADYLETKTKKRFAKLSISIAKILASTAKEFLAIRIIIKFSC